MNDLLLEELYKRYSFIEEDKSKFKKIAFKGLNSKDKELKEEATKNIVNYIISKIKNKKLNLIFDKTVNKMGIEKSFILYDMIIQEIEEDIEIDPTDLMKISGKSTYQTYFKKIIDNKEEIQNGLLYDVIDIIKRETDLEDLYPFSPNVEEHVRDYFKELRKSEYDVLDREEEQVLLKKYRETQDEDIKAEFINHNLRLAASIASKERTKADSHIPLMDLIQEGNLGIIRAFEDFDETTGYKFSTYAWYWIRSYVRKCIANDTTIRIPISQAEQLRKRNQFIYEYVNKFGKEPTEEEIIKSMDLNEEKYYELKKSDTIRNPYSLDSELDRDVTNNEEKIANLLAFKEDESTSNVEDSVINKYLAEQILINAKLKPKQMKVIKERYGFNKYNEPKTQQQISDEIGIVRERIRQIENESIEKLQECATELGLNNEVKSSIILGKKDLIKKLEEKGMNIKVILYRVQTDGSRFECKDCGNIFTESPVELLKRESCPFCKEKQLIKNKKA